MVHSQGPLPPLEWTSKTEGPGAPVGAKYGSNCETNRETTSGLFLSAHPFAMCNL
jgi:hypothetical protein